MPTLFDSNTHTCVIDTPKTINVNVAGTYRLWLDLNAMTATDYMVVRCRERVLTGGTSRLLWETGIDFNESSVTPIWKSLPEETYLSESSALEFEFVQTDGTGRNVPYAVVDLST